MNILSGISKRHDYLCLRLFLSVLDRYNATVKESAVVTAVTPSSANSIAPLFNNKPEIISVNTGTAEFNRLKLGGQPGDYNITFALAGKEEGQCIRGTMQMDFMSIMRCLVPECSSVYIALTHDVYTTLRSIKPAFRVSDLDLHDKLSCEMSGVGPDDEDTSLICWLRAYYVLGGTEYMETVEPEDMAVRLLIAVQSRTNNDDDGDCDTYAFTENHNIDHLMVYCSLLEQNFAQLLRTQPFEGGKIVDNLVHDVSRILVPSKRVQVGPGTSVMWFAKPTE